MTTDVDRLPLDRTPTWAQLLAAARRRAAVVGMEDLANDAEANAGVLLKGARDEGWDVVIPGSGYDDCGLSHVPAVIILGGPGGPLEEAVWVAPEGPSRTGEEPPVTEFLFQLADGDCFDPEMLYEVRFDSDPLEGRPFSTFRMDLVLTESTWGFPDFREPTHGWASWLGDELIVAWTEPGNDDQGAQKTTIEGSDDLAFSQAFWVRLARAIALVRGLDGGL
jgi:hypothetical protein